MLRSPAALGLLAPAPDQQLQQPVLRVVGVLVLVHQHMAERRGVALAHLRKQLEQVDRPEQQVVEVHRVHPMQVALVDLIHVGHHLLERGADRLAIVGGGAQAVLRRRDLIVDRGRGEALGVDAHGVGGALGQAAGVGLVVDRELARVPEPLRLRAQDARAGRVEGHQPHAPRAPAEQLFDPPAHLLGGLVGERDREDLPRLRLVGVDEKRDPVGEHARLATARAGQYQQRSLAVGDGLALGLVQPLQQLLEVLCMGVFGHETLQHRCALGGPGRRRRRAHAPPKQACGPPHPCARAAARSG